MGRSEGGFRLSAWGCGLAVLVDDLGGLFFVAGPVAEYVSVGRFLAQELLAREGAEEEGLVGDR